MRALLLLIVTGVVWIHVCAISAKAEENPNRAALVDAVVARQVVASEAPDADAEVSDWLVTPVRRPAELRVDPGADHQSATLVLANGLVSRTFVVSENLVCVGFKNLVSGAECVRSTEPEARVRIDGSWYDIGGMDGPEERAYLLESWLAELHTAPGAFRFVGLDTQAPEARYPWHQKFHAVPADWPPRGLRVNFHFAAPETIDSKYRDLKVTVHYEVYVGLPVVAKWFTLENGTGGDITIDEFESERLAATQDQIGHLYSESDYSFTFVNNTPGCTLAPSSGSLNQPWHNGGSTTLWRPDPRYTSWANNGPPEDTWLGYPHNCLLVSRPPLGPDWRVAAGEQFDTYVNFELLHDNDDRERQTLAHRKFYRRLAPQVTESLLSVSSTADTPEELHNLIDQEQELGFEAIELPPVDHSNLTPEYVAQWKAVADYAAARGIVVGGYEMQVAMRTEGKDVDVIDPETKQPGSPFGNSVCICSAWKDRYYPRMFEFFDQTGFRTTNFDGPYHGDVCAATDHPHHRGLNDSQWAQWRTQVDALHEFQRRDYYIPLPESYFLNGSCSTGMGYREASLNLSPAQQLLLGRQFVYDGTWHKTPTMGWMFLQLVGYYSRETKVGLEPLAENLDRYERNLVQYLGSGCRLSVRGARLYDTPATKALVSKWTDWYHKYRPILSSDIIHVERPTGRDLDCMFHVNPELDTRGLAVVFNPTPRRITRKFKLPLYYAGLSESALVREQEGDANQYSLDSRQQVEVPIDIEADGFTWFVVESGKASLEATAVSP